MDSAASLLLIAALIAASAFFSIAELAVAASRRMRLRQMADQGDVRAQRVLAVQDEPGDFFTAIQIGMNTVAILGGVVGEGAFSPLIAPMLQRLSVSAAHVETASAITSFVLVTSLFILLADLFPKRLGMSAPEQIAVRIVGPMHVFLGVVRPLVWLFKRLTVTRPSPTPTSWPWPLLGPKLAYWPPPSTASSKTCSSWIPAWSPVP
jgi:CBS domain containing-hemolysin-like protein